jgi:hypothetical protein
MLELVVQYVQLPIIFKVLTQLLRDSVYVHFYIIMYSPEPLFVTAKIIEANRIIVCVSSGDERE